MDGRWELSKSCKNDIPALLRADLINLALRSAIDQAHVHVRSEIGEEVMRFDWQVRAFRAEENGFVGMSLLLGRVVLINDVHLEEEIPLVTNGYWPI